MTHAFVLTPHADMSLSTGKRWHARVKTIKSSVKPSVVYPSLSNKGAVAVQSLRIYLETVAYSCNNWLTRDSRVTNAG